MNFLAQMLDDVTCGDCVDVMDHLPPPPRDLGEDLMSQFGRVEKLCPSLHLPFQSGSDAVLKRMSRLYTQQVRSMQQGQIQRSRWSAGRTWALREWGLRIIGSPRTSLLNKFATLAELAALTPVMHLTAATVIAGATVLVPSPARWWIASAALASLLSPVVATWRVLLNHPEPASTLSAFARLPVYATWRVSVAARTLLLPATGEWRKTERNAP